MGSCSPDDDVAIYVHIPFCARKCPYCDFVSSPVDEIRRAGYLRALESEIRGSEYVGLTGKTLYVGGGTPSELQPSELKRLLLLLERTFSFLTNAERTIECNPNSVTPTLAGFLLESGFNRVSLGVQSFFDNHLQRLGRLHNSLTSLEAFRTLRRAGFTNINLDLIFGLPGQTLEEWQVDLKTAIELGPEHLSLYSLTIEPGTEFARMVDEGVLNPADSDISLKMLDLAQDLTRAEGYERYEISNYCRKERECAHNLVYWKNQPYVGFGLSASSFMNGTRWTNTADWNEYEDSSRKGRINRSIEEQLPTSEAMGEEIMLRLRTRWGISPSDLSRKYGCNFQEVFGDLVDSCEREGLLQVRGDRLCLTHRGIHVADEICAQFIQRGKTRCVSFDNLQSQRQ